MLNKQEQQFESRLSPEAKEWVNSIFDTLEEHVLYFRLNRSSNQGTHDKSKREWAKTLLANNLTKEKVLRGINRIRTATNSLKDLTASEFIHMCKANPEDIGAPEVNYAYKEACRLSHPTNSEKEFSHPVVRYAFNEIGSYTLRTESQVKTYAPFEKYYLEACDLFADGKLQQRLPNPENNQIKEKGGHTIGKYDFVRPGVLRQYEGISSHEEALAVINKILGKGNSSLRKIINRLERNYEEKR